MLLLHSLLALCLLKQSLVETQSQTSFDDENKELELAEKCECVLYYQCDTYGYIKEYGEGLIKYRDGNDRVRFDPKICKGGSFEGQLYCCRKNPNDPSVETKSPDTDIFVSNTTLKPTKKKKCGVQRPIINVRVFAGEDELAPVNGEFPWLAAIFKKDSGEYHYYAAGALIHPNVVLTVNHYFIRKKISKFKVILNGNIQLAKVGENVTDERNIVEVINHPEYSSGNLANDVALLILDEPYMVTTTNYINKICLHPNDADLAGRRCLVAGWGKGSTANNVMKKVELPFVDHATCQELFRKNTDLPDTFELDETFMCAGGEKGKDACKGDGGSPLMCSSVETGRYFIAGIVSWGKGCGEENVPGAYASIKSAKKWIIKELEKKEIVLDD